MTWQSACTRTRTRTRTYVLSTLLSNVEDPVHSVKRKQRKLKIKIQLLCQLKKNKNLPYTLYQYKFSCLRPKTVYLALKVHACSLSSLQQLWLSIYSLVLVRTSPLLIYLLMSMYRKSIKQDFFL